VGSFGRRSDGTGNTGSAPFFRTKQPVARMPFLTILPIYHIPAPGRQRALNWTFCAFPRNRLATACGMRRAHRRRYMGAAWFLLPLLPHHLSLPLPHHTYTAPHTATSLHLLVHSSTPPAPHTHPLPHTLQYHYNTPHLQSLIPSPPTHTPYTAHPGLHSHSLFLPPLLCTL